MRLQWCVRCAGEVVVKIWRWWMLLPLQKLSEQGGAGRVLWGFAEKYSAREEEEEVHERREVLATVGRTDHL